MADERVQRVVDSFTLRFDGENSDGSALHELRAAHVAEVLQGLVGLTSDFNKSGVFHKEGPATSEVLVRPAREGSFLLEIFRVITENPDDAALAAAALGVPSISSIIWWATKSARAEPKDIEYLDNGNVKINWQDDTVDEVPVQAWRELQKRKSRRKKQLRQIMAPLSDQRVTRLDIEPAVESESSSEPPEPVVLNRSDYDALRPEDEVVEERRDFEIEAQMSAIDFDDPTKWRIKTTASKRAAIVEDRGFLNSVAHGLAIRKSDIFWLHITEVSTMKNGRTRTTWTVTKVERIRRATGDDDQSDSAPAS